MKRGLNINFICVGFAKCGTTLLQEVLAQNKDLFLSERKETWFFQWKDTIGNPLQKLKKDFFYDAPEKKKWGIIDPTFINQSRQVSNYFGKDCKIIFMVRNPVEVVYSDYKMKLRTCQDDSIIKLYWKYGYKKIDKMFCEYVSNNIRDKKLNKYYFTNLIKKYRFFYKRENTHIIVLEKLLQNPVEELKKLENFLETKSYDYELVKVNEGGAVSKNYLCAIINKWVFKAHMKLYSLSMSKELRQMLYRIRGRIFSVTHTAYEEKMSEEARKKLEEYFIKEKEVMTAMTGENLDKLWF